MLTPITSTLVPEDQRLEFLPSKLGMYRAVKFEALAFNTAGNMSKDYGGGMWAFYDLDNGGFFIAPDDGEPFECEVLTNGYRGTLSPEAFGIVCTLFAINRLLCSEPQNENLHTLYYALRGYALRHAEAQGILSAID